MKYRHRVLVLLVFLFAITYIDRVCISVAGPRIQEDLGIDPVGWGWVTAMFTLAYGLFEDPDRRAGRSDRTAAGLDPCRAVVVGVHLADRHGVELRAPAADPILLRCRRSWRFFRTPPLSYRGGSHSEPARQLCGGVAADGEPEIGRSDCAAAGRADPDPIWMAGIVLRLRLVRPGLGRCLVRLVP